MDDEVLVSKPEAERPHRIHRSIEDNIKIDLEESVN
jgi:hypothetical protein